MPALWCLLVLDLLGEEIRERHEAVARAWVDHFNRLMGRSFRCSKETEKAVKGLMERRGATLEDMRLVTEFLKSQWEGTQLEKYLVPDTILRPMKWSGRLDQAREWKRKREAQTLARARESMVVTELKKSADVLPPDAVREEAAKLLAMLKGGGG